MTKKTSFEVIDFKSIINGDLKKQHWIKLCIST